jgi:hypothetical protein
MLGNVILLSPNYFNCKCLKLFHIFLEFLKKKTQTWSAKKKLHLQASAEDWNEICNSILKVIEPYNCNSRIATNINSE